MKINPTSEDPWEEPFLQLEELAITSELFYQSLLPIMTALRSGRSPRTAGLKEKLPQSQEYLNVLHQIQDGLEKSFAPLKKNSPTELNAILSHLEHELNFYRQFQEASELLIKKLYLFAEEGRLSSLGQMPINDAWEGLEKLAKKI